MEIGQKIGVAILMFIPATLGGVYLFDILHSWLAVLVWLALMPVLYWAIINGKLKGSGDRG